MFRIYLSPPHMGPRERELLLEAFDSNWVAPLGPHVDAFEEEFSKLVGTEGALALSSGTAALHLALLLRGVGPGDTVLTSTLTFAATAFAIRYTGATPIFIDSDRKSWNMDPGLLEEEMGRLAKAGHLPKAVIPVHLYGQCCDMDPILATCNQYGVPVVEDAAEALGATYRGRMAGALADLAIFSFNGNKMITTSGGGMLVGERPEELARARYLSTQARAPFPHYEHLDVGYNYRLSNLLAAVGRGQLSVLGERIRARRATNVAYRNALAKLPGIEFMPDADFGEPTSWLTCLTIEPKTFGASREDVRTRLASVGIESRPVWKPMHLQPIFRDCRVVGGEVAQDLFERGLCLPSGSSLGEEERSEVASHILAMANKVDGTLEH